MWNTRNEPPPALGITAGTILNDVSEAERHNDSPNTVSVTLLEDRLPSAGLIPTRGAPFGARGQEVQVSRRSAAALSRSGAATIVNTAKLGAAQRRLLLRLFELTLLEERPEEDLNRLGGVLGTRVSPLITLTPNMYKATPIPWSSSLVTDPQSSAARSSVSQALANLERRGLVIRLPLGAGNRTQSVEVTQAGRRVAKALASKP